MKELLKHIFIAFLGCLISASSGLGQSTSDSVRYSIGNNLIENGISHARMKRYDSAVVYFNNAFREYELIKDTSRMLNALRNLGVAYKHLNQPVNSINSYINALELIDEKPNYHGIESRTLNSLGLIYFGANSFDKAKFYFEEAIEKSPDSDSYHIWLNNLGNTKLELEQFYSAIQDYEKSLSLKNKLGVEKSRLGLIYNNLGEALFRSGSVTEGKQYLDSALVFRQSDIYAWNNLAWYYLEVNVPDSADYFLNKSATMLDHAVNSEKVKYYRLKRDWAERVKDYNAYLRYDELYDSLSDVVFRDSRLMLQEVQSEYEIGRRDNELNEQQALLLAQQTIISKNTKLLIALVVIVALILISTIYFIVLNSKNRKLRLRNELLVREQNHRVKNNLQMISSLLSLQVGKTKDEASKEALIQSQGRIQAIALLNRSLYDQEEIGDVNLQTYLHELVNEVIDSVTSTQVIYNLNVEQLHLDIERTTSLGLIVNELIVNSVKHSGLPQVEFDLSITSSTAKVELNYADNGESFSPGSYEKSQSFGRKLIELQAKQLKAKVSISDQDSFQLRLVFNI
ncbi:tetratricopeptide repeat-containing sensor histidine kinase [Roseivirga pacifica]|uniref:tetratricopeptide repeat-containing sensor histidine kinase n=1 Tax=Roseivirga pacifica TaxID=1267423 RepID=UPI003BAD68D7